MIEISPSALDAEMTGELNNLEFYDWIFFTSKNGVINFFKLLIDAKGHTELPEKVKLAAIGHKTGLELEYYGYAPAFVSEDNTAEEFLNRFCAKYQPENLGILLCLGNLADDLLQDRLSVHNTAHRINVYQTVKPDQADPEIIERLRKDQYDLIIFTSPSTFRNLCSFYDHELIEKLKMASIGMVTTKAIQEAGFEPLFTAKKSNAEGIKDAILEFYQL
jgi:uroporphyrinogen-III synthase